MMFFVGYISFPPTTGLSIHAPAETAATINVNATTTSIFCFISENPFSVKLRLRIRYAVGGHLDWYAGFATKKSAQRLGCAQKGYLKRLPHRPAAMAITCGCVCSARPT